MPTAGQMTLGSVGAGDGAARPASTTCVIPGRGFSAFGRGFSTWGFGNSSRGFSAAICGGAPPPTLVPTTLAETTIPTVSITTAVVFINFDINMAFTTPSARATTLTETPATAA